MINAISAALSGATAAARRLEGAAGNLANQRSAGRLEPRPGEMSAYQPVVTVQQPAPGGGTVSSSRPTTPATMPSFEPDSPLADAHGLAAEPNVDPAREMAEMLVARQSFEANLKTVLTASQMQESLLETVA